MKEDSRIAQRRAQVRDARRRVRLRRTVIICSVLLLVALLYALERSSLVALREVRVSGVEALDPADIRDAAGLQPGTSIVRLDLGDAEQQVTALPRVETSEASRVGLRTVQIMVTERQPVAAVSNEDASRLLDADGVVIAAGRDDALPQIRVDGRLPPVGDRLDDHPGINNALAARRALPGTLRVDVVAYLVVGPDDVHLQLTTGTLVQLGRADRLDEKARALAVVLEQLEDRVVQRIDVRAPTNPVVVP